MLKINILSKVSYPTFQHQFDYKKFGDKYSFSENSNEDIVWDVVVVYEGCKTPQTLKHRKGGLIFISGEPPLSRIYPKQFAKQFDLFITTHKNINSVNVKKNQLAINWHFGLSFKTKVQKYNFEQLLNLPVPEKTKLFSIVTSSKKMMPGHNYRQNLIHNLKRDFGDVIDFYGDGVNNVEYKSTAILPYMFHICMENSEVEHYWSEKFADPLLGYSIPIYAGCPNIHEYFGTNGYFNFDLKKYADLKRLIDLILKEPEITYSKMLEDLLNLRTRLLCKYNFYNLIDDVINNQELRIKSEACTSTLIPYEYCKTYKYDYSKMRLKRYAIKLFVNLTK